MRSEGVVQDLKRFRIVAMRASLGVVYQRRADVDKTQPSW